MFKLYKITAENFELEIFPQNGLYVVYELFEYKFIYSGEIVEKSIFIEDELFDFEKKFVSFKPNTIILNEKKRIFEDYFGYLTFKINNDVFNFEVRIQKLKVPELEDILLYLWNQEPLLFDNFLSKSTLKSKLDKDQQTFDFSSKFVNIYEEFYQFFNSNFFTFKALPHYVLRNINSIKDYEIANISNDSIDWLMNNLDELQIDYSFKNIDNSIKINNSFGIIDKIMTEEKINDFNVYENQIILGAFSFVLFEIAKFKKKVSSFLNSKYSYEKDFYSINEFKVIPFLKIKDDIEKIEQKIYKLKKKYETIFINTKINNSFPKLTPVFSNKKHYNEAYRKIKLIRDVKISLDGELNLLNIKKVSTLYERFNLFVLINSILEKKPNKETKQNPKEEDFIFQEFNFQFPSFSLSVYYDEYLGNEKNEIGLQRISKGHYKPDYIIKITKNGHHFFYILDSKYSSLKTVKNIHMRECIRKYVLDLGINEQLNQKVEELILIYPGEIEEVLFGNDTFKPKISILPSKVKISNLNKFVDRLFKEYLN